MKTRQRIFSFVIALLTGTFAYATIDVTLQMQTGNPSSATTDPGNHAHYLIQRSQYAMDYNDTTREPNWVAWDLTADDVGSSGRSNFIVDDTLPAGFYQVLTTDYSGSGYDRGHMCPSADRTVTVADNQQVFYMSNMIPQAPDNNQGVWANFESYCRSLAAAGNEVLIISGPSGFNGSTIPSGVAIPGYTWKIAVVVPLGPGTAINRITSSTRVIAIKIPNTAGVRSTPWENFITSVAQIEADTGYTFFTALPGSIASALRTVVDGQSSAGSPAITAQPSSQTTVVGGAATFSVTATGDAPLAYQWLHDDVEIAGATAATLELTNVQAADMGSYYAVVTNAVGSATSTAASLVVTGVAPSITSAPTPQTVNAGMSVTFAVSALGSPTLTYQWRKAGNAMAGATASSLTLTNVQAIDAAAYDVIVANSVGTITSSSVALTVIAAAPTITVQPVAHTATLGGTTSFSVTATGTSPLGYLWRKDGTALANGDVISGATTATLVLTGVAAVNAGSYDVVVSNGLGSVTSSAATLTVTAPPPAAITWNFATATPSSNATADVSAGAVTQNNNNGTTTMITSASVSSGYTGASGSNNAGAAARTGVLNMASGGSAYFEFALTPIAGKRLVVNSISFGSRSTSTGPQAYAIYSSLNSFTTAIASGTLGNNSAWVLQSPSFTSLNGATDTAITFRIYGYNGTGSATAGTANWRIDDLTVTASTVFPPPVAPVVVSATPAAGATGIAVTTPISVTFNEAVSFIGTWFNITSAANGATAATVTGGPITYTLTPPAIFAYNDTITVTILGSQVVDQATGAIPGTGTTTFTFATASYTPPSPPSVTTQPTPVVVTAGSTATFTVAANGTAPLSYQWRKNSTAISGNSSATTATLTLANVTTADSGSYSCLVSNTAGSDLSQSATLTVTLVPPSITTQPAGQMTTVGGGASFTVAASGTAPLNYQWRKNGVALANSATIADVNTAALSLTGLTAADSATYDVVVTNAAGSATSSPAALAVSAAVPSAIYWDFSTAAPTSGVPANVTGGTVTQGNNNGTTPLLTTTSASGSYAGASGGNNAGAAARIGALNQASGGSAYFEFSLTPAAGRQFAATGISFGMRSTGTGPQAFAIYSSVDNYASPISMGPIANNSTWTLIAPVFSGVTGAAGAPVTFRLFGYNGTGSPGAGTANWRIDDLKLTAGVLALPAVTPAVTSTSPADGATYVALNAPITITFNQAVNVTGSWFTITSTAHGALAATVSGGPTTFTFTPAASFAYGDTITVMIAGSLVTEQATGTLTLPANSSFSFMTVPPVPPSIVTPPAAQTATVGDSIAFHVVATGTVPFGYQWRKGGVALAGNPSATTDTLTFASLTTAEAGDYDCVVSNVAGSATSTAAPLTVNKALANLTLSGLTATYDGAPKPITVGTTPGGLGLVVTYDGSTAIPANAGSYAVLATIVDANYVGFATATLTINRAPATVALGGLSQTYTGSPLAATAMTGPLGLPVQFTYDGSATPPTNAGSYTVAATVTNPNYLGTASSTLTINRAPATITLAGLAPTYDGTPRAVTATTEPAGLNVSVTYDGSATAPVGAGSYAIAATINEANYAGAAAGTLTISKAGATVALTGLSQTYDGSAKPAGVTTTPASLITTITYDGSATPPTNAGSYVVVATVTDANFAGTATGTLVVAKAAATLTLANTTQTYDGSAKPVTVTTAPAGVATAVTYDGSVTAPSNAGIYGVAATATDPNYTGSAAGSLTIDKAVVPVVLSDLTQTYNGMPRPATATTTPAGFTVNLTYNGSAIAPTNAGSYAVVASIANPNYRGAASGTLVIAPAAATIALSGLTQTYDGLPKAVTTITTPTGLAVNVTYNGSATAPSAPGSYAVAATATDPNYAAAASGTLVISTAVLVRHAPSLSGGIDGSLRVLLPEGMTLNGNAYISGDLLVPGTPAVQLNGHPTYAGTVDGPGAALPSNFTITLNGNSVLRHVVRRTDAATMPPVSAPPLPTGTRSVSLNSASDLAGDFATIRNLTLNGNAGTRAVPAGTYATLTVNGNSDLILGVAGATTPAVYNLQGLTLNGNSTLQIVGPVIINLASGMSVNGSLGDSSHPEWLAINLASGNLTLNGNVLLSGSVNAPAGTVTINGNGALKGGVTADRLTVNGNGLLDTIP